MTETEYKKIHYLWKLINYVELHCTLSRCKYWRFHLNYSLTDNISSINYLARKRKYFYATQQLFLSGVLWPNYTVALIFSSCLDRFLSCDVRCYAYFSWTWIFKMFPVLKRSCMWYCLKIFWKTPKCFYFFLCFLSKRAQTQTHFATRRACMSFSDHWITS